MMGTTIPVYAGMTPVVEVRPMGPGFRRGDTFIFGRRRASEGVSRRKSRCPGPLEVEAAEVAGDVEDFADEIEARYVAGFHRFRRKVLRIDAACGDFRRAETLRPLRFDAPAIHLLAKRTEALVGEVREAAGDLRHFAETFGKAFRQEARERRFHFLFRLGGARLAQFRENIVAGA